MSVYRTIGPLVEIKIIKMHNRMDRLESTILENVFGMGKAIESSFRFGISSKHISIAR